MSHRAAALEELLLLWTANRNEAFKPFEELFEDKPLAEKTVYRQVTQDLPQVFRHPARSFPSQAQASQPDRSAARAGHRRPSLPQRTTGPDPPPMEAAAGRQRRSRS